MGFSTKEEERKNTQHGHNYRKKRRENRSKDK
jgi:hypothetical protein